MIFKLFVVLFFCSFISCTFIPSNVVCVKEKTIILKDGDKLNISYHSGLVERQLIETRKIYDSPTGNVNISNIKVIKQTNKILLKDGNSFGLIFSLKGIKKGERVPVNTRFDFPCKKGYVAPFILPMNAKNGEFAVSHTFSKDEPQLNIPGIWTISVFVEEKLIIKQSFDIVKP